MTPSRRTSADPSQQSAALALDPIIATMRRGPLVESVHHGRAVVTDPDGRVVRRIGEVELPFYPRSAAKPFQAIAMHRLGMDLEAELLALAAASHHGEDFHIDGVRRILAAAELPETALQTPADLPHHGRPRDLWVHAHGPSPAPVLMNCSGKHAAMLLACVRAGLDVSTYRDPEHPLQQEVQAVIAEYSGQQPGDATVDGCGAPLWSITLTGLARGFGRWAATKEFAPAALAQAYRAYPQFVSGSDTDELRLHRAVRGLVTKGGAEGCLAIGLESGYGIAIKMDDGSARALMPVAVALLRDLDVTADQGALDQLASVPVLGHGEPVGEITAALD